MTTLSYIMIPGKGVTIVLNGTTPLTAKESHPNFAKIIQAIKDKNVDAIPDLINIIGDIKNKSQGKLLVDLARGTFIFDGVRVHDFVTEHIKRSYAEGFDVTPTLAFLENCLLNPDPNAVTDLYKFLMAGQLPITEDGHFIAYKRVNDNYTSVHDGRTNNSIGAKPSLPRASCNTNRDQTCSTGLHFCSQQYLNQFSGARIVIVKVNPRDVTSIPSDYHDTKGRACTYEIISELTDGQKETALAKNVLTEAVYAPPKKSVAAVKPVKKVAPIPKMPVPVKKVIKTVLSPASAWPFPRDVVSYNSDKHKKAGWNWPSSLPTVVHTDQYQAGYSIGYDCGKAKKAKPALETNDQHYNQGTIDGYADGRHKKDRLYKTVAQTVVPAKDLVQKKVTTGCSRDFNTGYRQGYSNGKNMLTHTTLHRGDAKLGYDRGYKDGKGHKRRLVK